LDISAVKFSSVEEGLLTTKGNVTTL